MMNRNTVRDPFNKDPQTARDLVMEAIESYSFGYLDRIIGIAESKGVHPLMTEAIIAVILKEEAARWRNRRDGADATARNAQGRDDRRRLAGAVGTGGLPPTPQRGEKDAISYVDWADGSTHDRTVFPDTGTTEDETG